MIWGALEELRVSNRF